MNPRNNKNKLYSKNKTLNLSSNTVEEETDKTSNIESKSTFYPTTPNLRHIKTYSSSHHLSPVLLKSTGKNKGINISNTRIEKSRVSKNLNIAFEHLASQSQLQSSPNIPISLENQLSPPKRAKEKREKPQTSSQNKKDKIINKRNSSTLKKTFSPPIGKRKRFTTNLSSPPTTNTPIDSSLHHLVVVVPEFPKSCESNKDQSKLSLSKKLNENEDKQHNSPIDKKKKYPKTQKLLKDEQTKIEINQFKDFFDQLDQETLLTDEKNPQSRSLPNNTPNKKEYGLKTKKLSNEQSKRSSLISWEEFQEVKAKDRQTQEKDRHLIRTSSLLRVYNEYVQALSQLFQETGEKPLTFEEFAIGYSNDHCDIDLVY